MKIKLFISIILVILAFNAKGQISINPSSGCAPLTPLLSASSVSGGVTYTWTIFYYASLNGSTSGQNTSYNFTTPGPYTINLDVKNGLGNTIFSDNYYLYVDGFTDIYSPITQSGGCPGDELFFYVNGSTPGNFTIDWDFGDGSPIESGTNNWGYHTYLSTGSYTVTATTNSVCGIQTLTLPISVVSNAPIGNIYVETQNDTVCPGDQVNFYMPGGYNGFLIDYGDGVVEQETYSHVYNLTGTYIVKATFFNGCGSSGTTTDTVYVLNNVPITNLSPFDLGISDTLVCPTSPVDFYVNGSFRDFAWNFGNGQTSTADNPSTTYSSVGTYPVSVIVTNGCGYQATLNGNVYVQNNITVPSFSISAPDSICPGTSAMIGLPSNIDDQTPIYFNFGDGTNAVSGDQEIISHNYSSPGIYTITATVVNGCGNFNSSSVNLVVNSQATINSASFQAGSPLSVGCPNDSLFFIVAPSDIGTFVFDFGDGNVVTQPTSYLAGPDGVEYAIFKHAYVSTGSFTPNVTVTSPCGSVVNQTLQTVTISNNNGIDSDAGFFYDESKYYCLDEPISFVAYGASTYEWNFGDGTGTFVTNASLVPINHGFSNPGSYTVKVKLINGCGAVDTFSREVIIPDSRIDINTSSVSSTCGQSNGKAIAIVSGNNAPFDYSWTNGDRNFIADTIPAGIYYVTVTDSKGCSSFAVATVSDAQAPTISVNNVIDASCSGQASGAIDITLIGSSAPYSFVWSNGKLTEDINQLVAGPYEIIVTDANGCKATKSITVEEPDDFTISYVSYPSVCSANTGVVQTNVQGTTGPYNFLWSNGYITPSVSGLGVGIYTITVVDSKGCLKDKVVTVNEIGGPVLILDSISGLNCGSGLGANVYVSTYLGSSPYTYNWNNGVNSEDLTNAIPGAYSLLVTSASGCKSVLTATIEQETPQPVSICAVTVDSTTQTNRLIWEQGSITGIASYNIYRESSQAGLYYLVGNVDADSLHQFVDPAADPSIRGWRYKISTVSDCNKESSRSDLHKTIHLTINQGLGNAYNLIWDNYEGLSFNKFYVWRFTTGTGWVKIDSLPSNLNSYSDFTAPAQGSSPDLYYMIEGGPISVCDPTRGAINTSRSNIKTARMAPTSISEISLSNFNLYPNPSTGNLNIALNKSLTQNGKINVLNLLGQTLLSDELPANVKSLSIQLNDLPNGVYLLRLSSNNSYVIRKFIISR